MSVFKIVILGLLVSFGLILSACGDSEEKAEDVNVPELVSNSLENISKQKSAEYDFNINVDAQTNNEVVNKVFPIKLSASGAASSKKATANFNLNFLDKNYNAELLSDGVNTYIKYLDQWYKAENNQYSDQLNQNVPEGLNNQDLNEIRKNQAELKKYLEQIFIITPSDEELNGKDVYKLNMKLNPAGIEKLASQEGEPLNADDKTGIETLAKYVNLDLYIGKEDELPYKLSFSWKQNQDLDIINENSEYKLDSIDIAVDLELDNYGTDFEIKAPDNAKSVEELFLPLFSELQNNELFKELNPGSSEVPTTPEINPDDLEGINPEDLEQNPETSTQDLPQESIPEVNPDDSVTTPEINPQDLEGVDPEELEKLEKQLKQEIEKSLEGTN